MSYEASVVEALSFVFDELGKTVVFKKKSSPIYNKWGEEESATYTDTDVVVLPLNTLSKTNFYSPFGDLEPGEQDLYVLPSSSIVINDELLFDDELFVVKDKGSYQFPSVVLDIIRIHKKL